jgi:F-type H+-transporting ATPase subunit gamma
MQTKAIKQKMKSIGNIQKITKTMEMVSVAKMKRAVTKTLESKQFSSQAQRILGTIASHPEIAHHPWVSPSTQITSELVVIIAGDKGLCGGYHVQIAKKLKEYQSTITHTLNALCIGSYSEKIANRLGIPIIASFQGLPETLEDIHMRPIKSFIIESFNSGEYQTISVVYTEYIKSLVYRPTITQLLPLSESETHTNNPLDRETTFEPSVTSVFESVAPNLLSAIVYQCALEAKASEHSSRMVAMKNASDNASDIKQELTITFNRVRQAAITQEITEIISGASVIQ